MVVLVTGGRGGIGSSIVDKYTSCGYTVFHPSSSTLNLASDDSISSYLHAKKIDIFVHCAGVNTPDSFLNLDAKDMYDAININTISCAKITKRILPYMIKNSFGRIVHVSSLWSIFSIPGRVPYSVSKAALDGLTRGLAAEFGSDGILVNSVLPGFVDTDLTRRNLSKDRINEIISNTPTKKLVEKKEVAELVYFLGSERNMAITGQSVVIDGGYSVLG